MRLLFLTMLLALSACFEVPKANISFRCGPAGECPDGYECRDDGCCHLPQSPADEVCTTMDAAVAADAPVDALRAPDAARPDAILPDAASPDAALPDAALPDAQ